MADDQKKSKIKHIWIDKVQVVCQLEQPWPDKKDMAVLLKTHDAFDAIFSFITTIFFSRSTATFTCNSKTAEGRGIIAYIEIDSQQP